MRKFKRAPYCGPVVYPNDRRKVLTTETVEGDEWIPYLSLGYVVEVLDDAQLEAAEKPTVEIPPIVPVKQVKPKASRVVTKKAKGNGQPKRDNISSELSPGESVDEQTHDRDGAAGLDSEETRSPEPEGSAG